MKTLNHSRIFFNALRTAILFVAGFLLYEILVELEKGWNKLQPDHALMHFHQRKGLKFVVILLIDLALLYFFAIILGIHV
ncbi:MAG: hypothetical protein ACOVRN_07400 [Flavobacterium sp.]